MVDQRQVGHVGGVVQFAHLAVAHMQMIDHRGGGRDQVDVIFTLDPVADDLQMQQAKEPAAKAKAERGGCFPSQS